VKYLGGPTRCPRCDGQLRFDTIAGRLVPVCLRCERRDRGECVDCGFPKGAVGRRYRCDRCHRIARLAGYRRYDLRHREERRAAYKVYYRRTRPQQLARKKVWRDNNQAKVKLYKRRGRLNGTWGYPSREAYLAGMRQQNEKRREYCREVARRRYYKLHPVRPDPHCRVCGARLSWQPRHGRPPSVCPVPQFDESAGIPCALVALRSVQFRQAA
jgi:hypothetical protein